MKLWQRRVLGILAVGGGAVGATLSVIALIRVSHVIEGLIYVAFSCLYAWGIWCGVKMFEAQPNAERYNRRFWLIQIPALNSPLLSYTMVCGFQVTLSLEFTPLKFGASLDAGSQFNFSLLQWDHPWSFGINVFALGIFLWMARKFPDVSAGAVQSPQ